MTKPVLTLASASPRRKELLYSLGINVNVCPADIDESRLDNEMPKHYVERLALQKAQRVQQILSQRKVEISSLPILAADTIVTLDNHLFGKPQGRDDAFAMWQTLSGKTHQVITAVALLTESDYFVALSVSKVRFNHLNEYQMQAYWETEEPIDKAGAYAIQGFASAWVASIEGSYTGVVGLPLYELNDLLKNVGLNWL